MARNPKVELRGHEGQVVHPITDGDCVIFPSGETLSHKLSEQEEVMYAPEVTNSSPMFKVGEGDSSDYSANVLEGAYQEAVLKGQTYVNTIQEPSADVITLPTPFTEYERTQSKTFTEMQDGTFGLNLVGQSYVNCIQEPSEPSYVALGENLEFQNKKVEYTSDGQIKSAMLNGMTLVNVGSYYSKSDFYTDNIDTITNDGYIQLTANGTWRNAFTKYNGMLKPSTKYLVIVDIKTNTLADGVQPFRLFTDGDNSDGIGNVALATGQTKCIECGATGVFKYIVTTASDLSNAIVTLRNYISNTVTSGIIVYRTMMIEYQEGMENWDIPYFQGMQSVTMTTELENVCSRYNSSVAKNGKTFTIGNINTRNLKLAEVADIGKYEFKPKTKYLLQFKITNLNLDGLSSTEIRFYTSTLESGNCLFENGSRVEVSKNGIYRAVFTTTNVISTSSFEIKGVASQWEDTTSTSRTLTISQIMCIEYQNGMENWDLPYFETTQLMKPLKVQSVNKNLFDGVWNETSDSSVKETANYFRVTEGKTYQVSSQGIINGSTCKFYDKNKKVVKSIDGVTIQAPAEAYYAKWFLNTTDFNSVQMEESSTETPYTPHQEKTISALEPITLRATGDAIDTLDLSTGEYIQRVGEVLLDGSQNWYLDTTATNTDTVVFYTDENYNGFKLLPDYVDRAKYNKSDKLPIVPGLWASNTEGIMSNQNGKVYIAILKSKLASEDVDSFKSYLASNPIRFVSILANPITRKISLEYPNLQAYQDITHVQSIAMNGTLIPKIFLPSDISYKAMLKPNTSYNVIVDREVIDPTNQLTVNLGGTTANITANRTVVTTPSTLSNETLTFSGKDNRIAKAMLIEGSTLINGDLPHFDGIGDVKLGRVVENLCMSNETLVGGATVTSTLYTDRIELKVTKNGSCVETFKLTKQLQNDKKYFIYSPSSSSLGNEYVFYGFSQDYNGSLNFAKQVTNFVNGKYSIITPRQEGNEYTHITIGNHGKQNVGTTYSIRRPILCEYVDGMENWDWESIGYFTGSRNIGNEFMRIGNKNLFDGTFYNHYWSAPFTNGGSAISKQNSSSCASTCRIPVKKGLTYTLSGTNLNRDIITFFKTDDMNEKPFDSLKQTTFTSPYDGYIEWYISNTHDTAPVTNVQIEEATSATSYVAHKHNSLHILPNEQIPLTFEQGATIFSTTTSFTEQINNTMTNRIRTGLLDLEPNETYRISFGDKNYICGIAFYDNSNIGLNAVNEISNDYVFTTTKDVHKICINIAKSDMNANITPSALHQVRLEKVTDVTLRGFGGVRDELDLTRGVHIQRIKEIVLNGSEQWKLCTLAYQPTDTNYINYDLDIDNIKLSAPILCDTIKTRDWTVASVEFNSRSIAGHSTSRILRLCIEKTIAPDVETLKTYLSTNMVKVQYQLRTPIEHKINIPMKNESNQTIAKPNGLFTLPLMYSETNHVDINSQIYPKVESRDYISYPVIANNSQLYTVFHNKVGTGNLTVNLCGTSVTSVDGTSKCTITTPSTISQYELRLSGARNKVSNVCVFSGDYMNVNVPYVEGMMNAVNPIVKNVGKNLINFNSIYTNHVANGRLSIDKTNQTIIGTNDCNDVQFYVYLVQGKTYTFNASGTFSQGSPLRLLRGKIQGYQEYALVNTFNNNTTFTLKTETGWYTLHIVNIRSMYNIQLEQSSTPSQYEPYKENICYIDCGEIRLTPDMFEQGSINNAGNSYETDKNTAKTRVRTKELIELKHNVQYVILGDDSKYKYSAHFYDKDGMQVKGSYDLSWKANVPFTVPSDAPMIAIFIAYKDNKKITVNDVDFNFHLVKVSEIITLRSLPNGIRDELNLQTGEYIQRIEEVVLDGSGDEGWILYNRDNYSEWTTYQWRCDLQRRGVCFAYNHEWFKSSCDKLIFGVIGEDREEDYEHYRSDGSNPCRHIYIWLNQAKAKTTDELKQYLRQNPITVQYELETPIVKQIDINNFPHSYKDGHVVIESNDPSTNVTAQMTYQCVANRTGQIQEHTEQVEKQEHEINELEMLILENIRQQQNR